MSDSRALDLLRVAVDAEENDALSPSLNLAVRGTPAKAAWPDLDSETWIAAYRLVSVLGEGGFGTVWRAVQSEPLVREVALKVIKPGMDSREVIARFEGERQALALMDHPNIARVLDAGTTVDGQPWFAMELVHGVPLTEFCDEQRLDLRQRMELFVPVCQAVHHAHQKGVLHRDLKPSNILVEMIDGHPVPKVIDFGIAKALDSGEHAAMGLSLLRTTGLSMIGTPQYMSPEQAGLRGLDVDSRSDIYSLGVILYELVCGSTPLAAVLTHKTPADEVLRLIREQDPPSLARSLPREEAPLAALARARQTDTRRLRLQLRGDLDWLVAKALEKDRDRRYNSAAALAEDIQRHLKNEPVSAGPPSPAYRFRMLARRNKAALAAAALVMASLLAGLSLALWQAVRATRAERIATTRLLEAEATRDAAGNLLVGNLVTLRDRLLPLGRADIMDEVLTAAEAYFEKLPHGMHNPAMSQQQIFLDLNRCALALARADTVAARRSLEAALLKVKALESAGNLPEPVAREITFISLIVAAELGRLDETASAKACVREAERLCKNWLEHDENTVWALGGMVHAAAILAFSAALFEGEAQIALEHINALASYHARLQAVAPDSVEARLSSAYATLAQAFVASSARMSQALAIRLFQNTADKFQELFETDAGTPWRDFYLHVRRRAMTAAAWRMVQLGAETGSQDQIHQGRLFLHEVLEQRLQAVEQQPNRADLWQDVVLSAKHLLVLARVTDDPAESEQLQAMVLSHITQAAARPMTPGAIHRAAQAMRECIVLERRSARPRPELIAEAVQLGVTIAARGLAAKPLHSSLLLPWTAFLDNLSWLAAHPEADSLAREASLASAIETLQAQEAAGPSYPTRRLILQQLEMAGMLGPLHRRLPESLEPAARRISQALRAIHESPDLDSAGKTLAHNLIEMQAQTARRWFQLAARHSPHPARETIVNDFVRLAAWADQLAVGEKAEPIDHLLAWAVWHAVSINHDHLPDTLTRLISDRIHLLLEKTVAVDPGGPLQDLAIANQLQVLDAMAARAEKSGDDAAAARCLVAIMDIRRGLKTDSAWHHYHWAWALYQHGVLDWRAGRRSAALKAWKEAEPRIVKSLRLNQRDTSASFLHLALRIVQQAAPAALKQLDEATLQRLADEQQRLTREHPGGSLKPVGTAWEILEGEMAARHHPAAEQAAVLRAGIPANRKN